MNSPAVRNVMSVVAGAYGFTVDDLASPSRKHKLVFARQMAMYVAYDITGRSTLIIGRMFNRDHTTVVHAIHKIRRLWRTNHAVADAVTTLRSDIRFQRQRVGGLANTVPPPSGKARTGRPKEWWWTAEQEQFVRENWRTMSDSQMGAALGRTRPGVRYYRRSLGLSHTENGNVRKAMTRTAFGSPAMIAMMDAFGAALHAEQMRARA